MNGGDDESERTLGIDPIRLNPVTTDDHERHWKNEGTSAAPRSERGIDPARGNVAGSTIGAETTLSDVRDRGASSGGRTGIDGRRPV